MWKTTDEFYSLFQCCGRKTVTGKPHCLWLIVFDVVVFLSHSMSYISQIMHRFQVFPWKTISWSFDTNLPDSGPDIGTDCHLPLSLLLVPSATCTLDPWGQLLLMTFHPAAVLRRISPAIITAIMVIQAAREKLVPLMCTLLHLLHLPPFTQSPNLNKFPSVCRWDHNNPTGTNCYCVYNLKNSPTNSQWTKVVSG